MQELVSVLMPVYNAGETLQAAIDSCLSQTYGNLELLVLNNGSTDNSSTILSAVSDPRMKVFGSEHNLGIAKARNLLLKEAGGKYIAWLDADDTMYGDRLEKQVKYMEEHPETDILGTWITTDNSELPSKRLPLDHKTIAACLWFKNCLVQPSILSRNFYNSEQIYYDESYLNAVEDYELWYRLRDRKRFANMPEYLTNYHMTTGIALELKKRNNEFESNIRRLWLVKWGDQQIELFNTDKQNFENFIYTNKTLKSKEINSLSRTLLALKRRSVAETENLILAFHTLRLWRNMKFTHKLLNLHLLLNLKHYTSLRKLHII